MKKHILIETRIVDDFDDKNEAQEDLEWFNEQNSDNRTNYVIAPRENLLKYGFGGLNF